MKQQAITLSTEPLWIDAINRHSLNAPNILDIVPNKELGKVSVIIQSLPREQRN